MRDRLEMETEVTKELRKVPVYNTSRYLQMIQIELLLDIRDILKDKYNREFPWEANE